MTDATTPLEPLNLRFVFKTHVIRVYIWRSRNEVFLSADGQLIPRDSVNELHRAVQTYVDSGVNIPIQDYIDKVLGRPVGSVTINILRKILLFWHDICIYRDK